jgi:hypothetical protein
MRRLAALAAAGGWLYLRRRRRAGAPRVDLYFADGSMVALEPGAPGVDALVAHARRAL